MSTNFTHIDPDKLGDNRGMTPEQMLQALTSVIAHNLRYRGEPGIPADEVAVHIRHVLWFHRTVMEMPVKGGTMPGAFTTQLLCLIEQATPADKARLRLGFPVYGLLMEHAARSGCWTLQRAIGTV